MYEHKLSMSYKIKDQKILAVSSPPRDPNCQAARAGGIGGTHLILLARHSGRNRCPRHWYPRGHHWLLGILLRGGGLRGGIVVHVLWVGPCLWGRLLRLIVVLVGRGLVVWGVGPGGITLRICHRDIVRLGCGWGSRRGIGPMRRNRIRGSSGGRLAVGGI